jgi:hypothetical protein
MDRIGFLTKWIALGSGVCLGLAVVGYWLNGLVFWFFGNLAFLGFTVAGLMTFWLLASWVLEQRRQGQAGS